MFMRTTRIRTLIRDGIIAITEIALACHIQLSC